MNESTQKLADLVSTFASRLASAASDPVPNRNIIIRMLLETAVCITDLPVQCGHEPDQITRLDERDDAVMVFRGTLEFCENQLILSTIPESKYSNLRKMQSHAVTKRLGLNNRLSKLPGTMIIEVCDFLGYHFMKAIIDFDRASMKKTMSGMKKRHLFELCDLIKDKVIAITNLDKTQAMRDAHADVVKKFTYHSKSTNEWFTESVLCIMRRMVVETANPAYKAIAVHYRKIVRTVAIILMVVSRNQKERECRKAARASKRKRT